MARRTGEGPAGGPAPDPVPASAGASSRVVVRLLGPPQVEVGERPLEVDTRKALAVLAVVAMDGPQQRDRLAALLWPDSDAAHAAGSFRRTLSVLNSALGEGILTADRRNVGLVPGSVDLDVAAFTAAIAATADHGHPPAAACADCREPLRSAVALHRGEFLADFRVRDAAEFEDWQAAWAERLRRELRQALARLSRCELEAGDLDAAMTSTESWLEVDPLNEQVHARLMLIHARRGERNQAIERYRDCVAILDRELGVRPLERTTRLYRSLLEGETDRPEASPPPPPVEQQKATVRSPRPDAGGLVGREEELELADRHLRPGASLVVRGEAGIGKTRFVEELEARLHRRRAAVVVGRCHADERGLSFGPVVDLVRAAVAMPGAGERLAGLNPTWLAEASRLVPELDRSPAPPPDPDPPRAQGRLLDALCQVLATALPAQPLRVVVLEDLHGADDATLDLVTYLGHRSSEHRLALVLTGRDEDLTDQHPLQRSSNDDDDRLVVTLGRLSDESVAAYLEVGFSGRPDLAALTARILQEADGLPLAVVEYSRWLAQAEPDADGEWPVPVGVREVVRRRLGTLSDTARQLVGAAAVIGHEVDEELVRQVAGRTEEETVAALEELVERRILQPNGQGTGYGFAHDRIRTVVYDDTNAARRRLLHARAAETLAARVGARFGARSAGIIAEHARLGGREEDAATWSVRAGDEARGVFANREARQHYQEALALGHPEPAAVHARLARLEVLDGRYQAALASFETAAARASGPLELAAIEHELGALHVRRRSLALGRVHLETALAAVDRQDLALAARITADLALLELTAGDAERAGSHTSGALRLAEEAGDRYAIAQARNVAGLLARHGGRPDEAMRHLEHAAALAATAADPTAYIAALNNLALTTAETGDAERAVRLLELALERCEQQGDRHRRAALLNNLADLHHRAGDQERSMELLKLAVSQFAEIGGETPQEPEIWKLTEW